MATRKITVTLPEELVEAAAAAVEGGSAQSVSGYVAMAVEEYARQTAMADVIAAMIAEGGEPTEQDESWARAALDMIAAPHQHVA